MKKNQIVAIIVAAVVLVGVIVAILVFHGSPEDEVVITTTSTTTVTVSTTKVSTKKATSSTTTSAVFGKGVNMGTATKDSKGYFLPSGDPNYYSDGLIQATIPDLSPESKLYYFTDGYLDTDFVGLAFNYGNYYYVKDGQAQTDFTGLVSYQRYLRIVENGFYRDDYTGTMTLGAVDDIQVKEGAIYGVYLNMPDGTVVEMDWHLNND